MVSGLPPMATVTLYNWVSHGLTKFRSPVNQSTGRHIIADKGVHPRCLVNTPFFQDKWLDRFDRWQLHGALTSGERLEAGVLRSEATPRWIRWEDGGRSGYHPLGSWGSPRTFPTSIGFNSEKMGHSSCKLCLVGAGTSFYANFYGGTPRIQYLRAYIDGLCAARSWGYASNTARLTTPEFWVSG